MSVVVDASVALGWSLGDEADPLPARVLDHLLDAPAWAPGLWWFELRNTLVVNERRGRLGQAETAAFLAAVARLPVALDREPEEAAVLALARQHRLTVYDAAYLELALRRGLPLASLDRALLRAAAACGVALFGDGDEPPGAVG